MLAASPGNTAATGTVSVAPITLHDPGAALNTDVQYTDVTETQ